MAAAASGVACGITTAAMSSARETSQSEAAPSVAEGAAAMIVSRLFAVACASCGSPPPAERAAST